MRSGPASTSMIDVTQRFTGRAAGYNQFRERYDPGIVLPRLRQWCGLTPAWTIADIGAGTGMLADVFLANGNRVLAVEPNPDMRAACLALHAGDEKLHVVSGRAEASTLPPQSVDLISMGRAFHWFDVDRAMVEFCRILRPEGWIASVTTGREPEGSAANLAVEALLRSFSGSQAGHEAVHAKYARLRAFLPRDYREEQIDGAMQLTESDLFGLLCSLSHAPLPGDSRFPDFENRTSELFAQHAAGGRITLVTRCWINAGRLP